MLALGIDIGGSAIKFAVVRTNQPSDGRIEVLGTGTSARYTNPNAEQVVECIRGFLESAKSGMWSDPQCRERLPADVRFACIGLCLPGLFDERARALSRAVNVPRLVGVCIDDLLGEALGGPSAGAAVALPRARVCTDAFAAAYDFVVGRGQEVQGRTLALSLGTGVGACVLDGVTPLLVSGGGPGHLGQMDVSSATEGSDVPEGADGARGTLEAYIGLRALCARYGDGLTRMPKSGEMLLQESPIRALVRALRLAHAIYRPDTIVLLGGVGVLLTPVVGRLHDAVSDGLTTLARPAWRLLTGQDAYHAARGAARLAIAH
jgi:predicted NBD/HSP70 family sugar kinase